MLSHAFGGTGRKPSYHEFSPGNVMLLCPADEDHPEGRVLLVTGVGLSDNGVDIIKAIDLHSSVIKQYGDFCLDSSGEFFEPVDDIKTAQHLLRLPVTVSESEDSDSLFILADAASCTIPPIATLGELNLYSGFENFVHFCSQDNTNFRAFYGVETFLYEDIKSHLLQGNMVVTPIERDMIFGTKEQRDEALLYYFGYPDISGLNIPLHDARLAIN